MSKKIIFLLILTVFVKFRFYSPVTAAETNIFGIHITDSNDLDKAVELVNSNGGDWGWVTIVIQENDRNRDKWQSFFDHCREKHLIPLVRIATYPIGDTWSKPGLDQVDYWFLFLNNLNWPTSDRYVIVYNEPNHDSEWGGQANPKEYALILDKFIKTFSLNPKFKILNGGFDLAAPNGLTTFEAFSFLQQMNQAVPGIFNRLSGWDSHSYPNHGFLGKPDDYKKTSIRGYIFELDYLKKYLGLTKNLPVFITETGWPYQVSNIRYQVLNSGKRVASRDQKKFYDSETTAEYLKSAFIDYWLKDSRIMAVTPFILNYPYEPFTEFSWINSEGTPSAQYGAVMDISKVSWQPLQESKYEFKIIHPPNFMPSNNMYVGSVLVKNVGESILSENGRPSFLKSTSDRELSVSDLTINKKLLPGEQTTADFTLRTSSQSGIFMIGWEGSSQALKVYPETVLNDIRYNIWQKIIIRLSNLLLKRYN